tara:strand:+ start:575 stop:1462 length:888 start_codon:yes stop_codon:yes gene_type:complete
MSEITPRMLYPYPSDREQPFFTSYKAGELARDASHWAHSENHNLVFAGGGTWTWDAGAGVLSWTDDVLILGFTTKQFMTIPAQSITVEDGEVVFFNVLRLLQTSMNVDLETAATIGKAGVRLHDLMLFATRIGDVVYFPGFNSMVDGDVGVLYGGGIPSGGGGGGTVSFITEGPGIDVTNPAGPNVTVAAEFTVAGGSNGVSTEVARGDHSHPALGHDHEAELLITPGAGFSTLDLDADLAITAKTLLDAQVYRSGQRLTQGALRDYTLNLPAKTASLNFTTILADVFVIDRRAI